MGRLEEQIRGVQSTCAAEVSAACADRALHKETLEKVQQLTSLNHKLTAAVAVAQLQAAAGVQDLLSQVVPAPLRASHIFYNSTFQVGLSSLSSKSPEHQAEFLSKAKVRTSESTLRVVEFFLCCCFTIVLQILLQSVRQENTKFGAVASAEYSSALDSSVRVCNI